MKGFGKTALVICIVVGAISLIPIFTGNQSETANGIVVLGSCLGGILMSCLLIAVADIRDILLRREIGQ